MDAADLIVQIEILNTHLNKLLNTKPRNLLQIEQGFSQRKELLYQLGVCVFSTLQQPASESDEEFLHLDQLPLDFNHHHAQNLEEAESIPTTAHAPHKDTERDIALDHPIPNRLNDTEPEDTEHADTELEEPSEEFVLDINQLRAEFFNSSSPPPPTPSKKLFHDIVEDLGESILPDIAIPRLTKETSSVSWGHLTKTQLKILLGLCIARVKMFQHQGSDNNLSFIFQNLKNISEEKRPGNVNGLARHHMPAFSSWKEDALIWWNMAQALINGQKVEFYAKPIVVEIKPSQEKNPEKLLLHISEAIDHPPQKLQPLFLEALNIGISATDNRLIKLGMQREDALDHRNLKSLRRAIRHFYDDDFSEFPTLSKKTENNLKNRKIVLFSSQKHSQHQQYLELFFDELDFIWLECPQTTTVPSSMTLLHDLSYHHSLVLLPVSFMTHAVFQHLQDHCIQQKLCFTKITGNYSPQKLLTHIEELF